MTAVPVTEARAQLFDIVERAANGEHITLTNRGVARAVVVPVQDDTRPIGFTREQALDIFNNYQMDAGAWDDIRFPGDTIAEDGLD